MSCNGQVANMLWHMGLSLCATHLCHVAPFGSDEVLINFPTRRGNISLGKNLQINMFALFSV